VRSHRVGIITRWPSRAWNAVIQIVTQVGFFRGDVLAYSSCSLDLGGASAGSNGKPKLPGSGLLSAGSEARIDLTNGPPHGLALIMLASPTAAPGGT